MQQQNEYDNYNHNEPVNNQEKEGGKTQEHPPIKYEAFYYTCKSNPYILKFTISIGELANSIDYRCKYRSCKATLKLFKEKSNALPSLVSNGTPASGVKVETKNIHTCNASNEESKENNEQKEVSVVKIEQLPQLKANDSLVQEMIRKEPLKGKQYFFEKSLAANIKISKSKIKDLLTEIREEKFPTNVEAALSNEYCKTKDDKCCQVFYQGRGSIRIPKSKPTTAKFETVTKSFIIFASIFMLKMLEEHVWFVDATFSIVPAGFYQLLTIMTYQTRARSYAPSAFILMEGKNESLYEAVFSTLMAICNGYNISIKPLKIMSDFESALRNALKQVFPSVELNGCFFHYCQCLWLHASKLGLRAPSRILDTKKLIALLKILPHIDLQDRKDIFSEIKTTYKSKDKPFKDFFSYYQNNWLENYTIKFE